MDDVVVVTGMSGAGRTTCLKILEDLGYEAVDNLPVNLLGARPARRRRRTGAPRHRHGQPDPRARGRARARLPWPDARAERSAPCLLFLECDDEVLRRRFTETRRRHPLADLPGVGDALAAERELMAPLKAAADLSIDTSELSLPDLRRILTGRFGAGARG